MTLRACVVAVSIGLAGVPLLAAELELTIDIPRMNVAEYHRPYVAVWVERSDGTIAANLAVWYTMAARDRDGTRWLEDLRRWWRRGGRDVKMPVDVVSGATRAPGRHRLALSSSSGPMASLPAGAYRLTIEAAREVGGRETLQVSFTWPPERATSATAVGRTELGSVSLSLRP